MFLQVMVRHVRFDGEHLNAVPMAIRADTVDLRPGMKIEVLVGTSEGSSLRDDLPGHWILCEIVAHSMRELVVKVLG